MGGSLAALAAPYVSQMGYFDKTQIKLIAFGEMRVGYADFADRMPNLVPFAYRAYHNRDMSAHIIPTSAGYMHYKNEVGIRLTYQGHIRPHGSQEAVSDPLPLSQVASVIWKAGGGFRGPMGSKPKDSKNEPWPFLPVDLTYLDLVSQQNGRWQCLYRMRRRRKPQLHE